MWNVVKSSRAWPSQGLVRIQLNLGVWFKSNSVELIATLQKNYQIKEVHIVLRTPMQLCLRDGRMIQESILKKEYWNHIRNLGFSVDNDTLMPIISEAVQKQSSFHIFLLQVSASQQNKETPRSAASILHWLPNFSLVILGIVNTPDRVKAPNSLLAFSSLNYRDNQIPCNEGRLGNLTCTHLYSSLSLDVTQTQNNEFYHMKASHGN